MKYFDNAMLRKFHRFQIGKAYVPLEKNFLKEHITVPSTVANFNSLETSYITRLFLLIFPVKELFHLIISLNRKLYKPKSPIALIPQKHTLLNILENNGHFLNRFLKKKIKV